MSVWLIDTVLYTGLLIGLVLVLRRPIGRFFGPQLAYALWALPFLRLLLPPIVLPATLAPEPVETAATPAAAWTPVTLEGHVESAQMNATAAAVPPPPAWEWADLLAITVSLWAGVALAFLAWRVVTYRRMRAELLRDARPVGEIGRIRLVETPALAAPVAFGVLDKVIGLPPLFMAQHDIAARDLAIAHEVAHHKGHDLLANFAAQALLALHWFNPLAWYGWRAMRRDQEAACDARVLAGRGREDRIRYAALIAVIATGPRSLAFRGALAAPMACPVLGERSIVHRLRSLSMSEMSRRRRWLGRSLIGASALALPLTASISYAAANVEASEPAREPDAAAAPVLSSAVAVEAADPVAAAVPQHHPHPDAQASVGEPGEAPPMPQFQGPGDPTDPEWQARMEAWGREMEQWGEKWGEQWGEQHRAHALALAEQFSRAPEIVESCDEGEKRRTTTADGRPRIVICQHEMTQMARSSLRIARDSIARNPDMSEEVRSEVLRELDQEINRLEREGE
jgi:beta-lactamase regulating signal transducer with metallopeptidase domain